MKTAAATRPHEDAAHNPATAAGAASDTPTAPPAPMKVLVVDDDRLASNALKLMLAMDSRIGTIVVADSPDAALALIQSASEGDAPNLVLLDVNFAGLKRTGIDYLGEFRAASPSSRLVVMSAGREPATVESAFANDADGFVWKNESSADFTEAIVVASQHRFVTSKSVVRDLADTGPRMRVGAVAPARERGSTVSDESCRR